MTQQKKINSKSNSGLISIITEWECFLKEENIYSDNTVKSYLDDIDIFREFITKSYEIDSKTITFLENFEIRDFRNFISFFRKRRGASSTARGISSVKNFYKFLKKKYRISNQYISIIKAPKKDKNLPRAINEEQVFGSIEEIEKLEALKSNPESWVGLRDKVLLSLIYACGLRISEALNIQHFDIKFDAKYISIIGKGNKERIVPIFDEILSSIKALCKDCPYFESKYIFYGKRGERLSAAVFQRTLRQVKNLLNLPEGTTPHAFRHSFATHLLANSGDLLSIKELMGHESIATTQKYTKIEASHMLKSYEIFS